MLHRAVSLIERFAGFHTGKTQTETIYLLHDPAPAIVAALSVVRMMDLMLETTEQENSDPVETQNTISRCIAMKEKAAMKVKNEVLSIWGSFIKGQQIEEHANVNETVHKIVKTANICKQCIDREAGEELIELVNQFAEVFWNAKEVETIR